MDRWIDEWMDGMMEKGRERGCEGVGKGGMGGWTDSSMD